MFAKRLSELTADDIKSIVERRVPEGIEVEFKRDFDGSPDGKNARDDIVKEIIAFANAYGGTLLIGIDEADRSAAGISPIHACKDVADRLARSIPDLVEPRLPGFECEAVLMGEGGAGVIALRVPASTLGPHRHTAKASSTNGQVYVRRNTESVMASMREIHDLVLNQARVADRLLDMRLQAYDRFAAEQARVFPSGEQTMPLAAFAVVAIPIGRLQVPDLIGRLPAERQPLSFRVLRDTGNYDINVPAWGAQPWSPRLRGIRSAFFQGEMGAALDLGEDGVVTTGFWYAPSTDRLGGVKPCVHLSWMLATAASVLVRLEWARLKAAYPDAQYSLSGRLSLSGDWTMSLNDDHYGSGKVRMGHVKQVEIPEHVVDGVAGFNEIMLSIERDLVNASGNSFLPGLRIDFDDALGS